MVQGNGAAAGSARGQAVVIGAGIVGLCNAAYLQRDGWRVTVVDPRPPGEACSFGNCGMMSDHTALPVATPGILKRVPGMLMDPMGPLAIKWSYIPALVPWLVRFVASSSRPRVEEFVRDFGTLINRAKIAYAPLIEDAKADHLIRKHGSIEVFESAPAFARAQWGIELRKQHGVPLRVVKPEEIRQIEPALGPGFAGAVFREDMDHVVNPLRFSQAIAASIRAKGGTFVQAEARDIRAGADGKKRVETTGATLDANAVVIAAGAWSKRFARQAGARVPLDTERGYHAMLTEPGVAMRVPVKTHEGGFFLTPMELGIRVAGTDELAGLKPPPNYKRIEPMLVRARRMVPGLNTNKLEPWMGFRPSLPDSKPAIGRAPGMNGVYCAFGHGHFGLTLAAATAEAVCDLAAGRTPKLDLAPFSPQRF